MPKHSRKKGRGGRTGVGAGDSNSDDESVVNDNGSVCSVRSNGDNNGGAGGSIGGDESDENGPAALQTSNEKFEEKLSVALENAIEKSAQTRTQALQSICEILMHRWLPEYVEDRKFTIVDIIEKSLRRGKGTEQAWAAQLTPLLILQLGGSDDLTTNVNQYLMAVVQDKTATVDARAKSCIALALVYFLGGDDNVNVITLMQQFETIFSGSYLKGDNTPSSATADSGTLHCAAINAWGLLLTLLPSGDFCSIMNNSTFAPSIKNLIGMLQSPHLDVRMVTGEIIALVLECGRAHDEEFLDEYLTELIEATKQLATDSHKYRAKRDRKTQRATFRDVLRYLEDNVSPDITIRFGKESLELDSWTFSHQYTTLCSIMGPGITNHLSENDFLRDVLQLGAKIIQSNGVGVGVTNIKQTKLERHLINSAAFKARTLSRSKNRDKRSAMF